MVKHGITSALSLSATGLRIAGVAGFLLFTAAAVSASDSPSFPSKATKAKAVITVDAKSVETRTPALPSARPEAKPVEKAKSAKSPRASLGDAFIAQNAVRVYLGRPMTISLHNARGQLLYHLESSRPMEVLPLNGVNTGFLYVTLRAGQLELTKKLVYSGK